MSKSSIRNKIRKALTHRSAKQGIAIALAFMLTGGFWLYDQHKVEAARAHQPAPVTMADQIRQNDSAWADDQQPFSRFTADIHAGNISEAISGPKSLYVSLKDGSKYVVTDNYGFVTRQTYDTVAQETMNPFRFSEMKPRTMDDLSTTSVLSLLMQFFVLLIIFVMALPMLGGVFFKRKHKGPKPSPVTFADVIGCSEAKHALLDITKAFSHPDTFEAVGARPSRGVLLAGPPGTGKTQLAKALATECGVNFMEVTGSDFSSPFMGMGIMKVKSLFRQARKKAPVIIFVDEIDGIGKRQSDPRLGEAEGNRIINQFLTELDGFGTRDGILLIGATNLAESLDPALRREGRFDRTITIHLPSTVERKGLLDLYLKKLPNVAPIDLDRLAGTTMGLTPAAIASIVNQAAIRAAREELSLVEERHMVDAIETQRIGEAPIGSSPFSTAERKRIAIHETGHAAVAALRSIGRVDKVTILPRGQALGVTLVIPTEDKRLHLKSELRDRIMMLLAGRVAEQLFLDETSSGAAQDLQEATKLAVQMVGAFGMGPRSELASVTALQEMGLGVDAKDTISEVNALLSELEKECIGILSSRRAELETIVDALLSDETISGTVVLQALGLSNEPANQSTGETYDKAAYAHTSVA